MWEGSEDSQRNSVNIHQQQNSEFSSEIGAGKQQMRSVRKCCVKRVSFKHTLQSKNNFIMTIQETKDVKFRLLH